jgi:hypothetical protein
VLLLGVEKPDVMRYLFNTLIAAFLLSSIVVDAQTNVSVSRKDFKTRDSGFGEAWKHISSGDRYYVAKGIWYNDAYNEYLQALVYNSSNAELNYKTGVAALFSDRKEDASGFLMKALELKKMLPGMYFCSPEDLFNIRVNTLKQSRNLQSILVHLIRRRRKIFCWPADISRNAILQYWLQKIH